MGEIYITLDGLREWIRTVASGRGARGASCGLYFLSWGVMVVTVSNGTA